MKNTLLDLTKRTAGAKEVGLIEENLQYAPEVAMVPAKTIAGTSYTTLARVGLPTVGFTSVNQGVTASKSTYKNALVQTFPLRSLVKVDKALVNADSSLPSLQTDEASGVMEAALRHIGRQFYYGQNAGGDSEGSIGLQDVVGAEQTFDASGTTADTGSSVYLVKFGRKDVQMVFGNNSTLSLAPFRDETLTDSDGGEFDGSVAHLTAWQGVQCTNPNSVVRIANLTEDSGKGLTDAILAKALALFPSGVTPDAIFMTRRTRSQLQADRATRTATRGNGKNGSVGGGSTYSPTPTDFEGIALTPTDSILNTEPLI